MRGVLPAGTRLEFMALGSPERLAAEGDRESGKYALRLPPARYDILLISSSRRTRGTAWLIHPEVELNAAPENRRPAGPAEYDLTAEWRVVNEAGQGVGPARVTLEAESARGARERLVAWVPDEEKEREVPGVLETTPDGRFVFRVRESRLLADNVVALRVSVEMKGYAPATLRITPVLEFSSAGHFFPRYPEEGVEIRLTDSRNSVPRRLPDKPR